MTTEKKDSTKFSNDNKNFNGIDRVHNVRITRETKVAAFLKQRTEISYHLGDSNNNSSYYSSEIDGLNMVLTSSASKLFTRLVENNIESPLVKHFSLCEQKDIRYTSPYSDKSSGNELFRYDAHRMQDNNLEHRYSLCQGVSCFFLISKHDPLFFRALLKALHKDLFRVGRLDICIDLSDNLMPFISKSSKEGKIKPFGAGLTGYGKLNGKACKKIKLGSNTVFFKSLKKTDVLELETLYRGHYAATPCVVGFYDKKKQEMVKHERVHKNETRIELRLFNTKDSDFKYREIIFELMLSACYSPSDCQKGQFIRHFFFVGILFSHIVFCRVKDKKGSLESQANWSNWYRELYSASMEACQLWAETLNVEFDLPFEVLSKVKDNPNILLEYLPKAFYGKRFLEKHSIDDINFSDDDINFDEFIPKTLHEDKNLIPVKQTIIVATTPGCSLESKVTKEGKPEYKRAKSGRKLGSKDSCGQKKQRSDAGKKREKRNKDLFIGKEEKMA